ncbi:MAG: glycosyltransferase [Actinobacteria bacterium]|nr:glycosyltransferase [Actinomycetota bacterium]
MPAPASHADPGPREALAIPPAQIDRLREAPPISVVVPVHNAPEALERCLDALLRNTDIPAQLLVIDDASTDPGISPLLERYGEDLRVRILRNERNIGFPATVNRGFAETEGDVVLLNSDAEVGPGWLRNLRLAAQAAPETATATPLSDNAGAFSAPEVGVANEHPRNLSRDEAARLVARASERLTPEIPVGNGFCMYIKRAAIDEVGGFDAEAFGRGYGEENDFCLRASAAGWRHVLDDAGLVWHERNASFGEREPGEVKSTRALIDDRHPEYTDRVRGFLADPEVRRARANVADAYRADPGSAARPRLLHVVHAGGGGTPQTSADLMRALADRYDSYLFTSDTKRLRLSVWREDGFEALDSWRLDPAWNVMDLTRPDYREAAASVLATYAIDLVHVRHLFKHTFDLPHLAGALGIPVVVSFHDGYLACPTVHLLDNKLEYCGGVCTPGEGQCYLPAPSLQTLPPLKHRWVYQWRRHVGEMLENAEACATSSEHTKGVIESALPRTTEVPFEVIEHGRDLRQARGLGRPPGDSGPVRILVAGNFDVRKGAGVIAGIKAHDLDGRLEFHFIGRMATGFEDLGVVHGPYERDEYASLVERIRPSFAACLAIVAESFSHVLTEAWSVGLPVLASDHGAFRERILRHGGGWLLDHRDPAAACARILEICDDPAEYERVAGQANIEGQPSTAEMANGYDRLYGEVLAQRRSLAGDAPGRGRRHLLRAAALLPGSPGLRNASSYVRCLQRHSHPGVRRELHATERSATELGGLANGIDAVLVQRDAVEPEQAPSFTRALADSGLPLVLELDDNLLEFGDSSPITRDRDRVRGLRCLAEASALTMVSTPRLAEAASRHCERVTVVPNMLDERLWMPANSERPPTARRERRGPVRIGYVGTRTHKHDLALLRPALELLQREGLELELELVGVQEEDGGDGSWYRRLNTPAGHSAYPRFVPWLRRQRNRWDLAVAPLQDTPFNRCKSDLKFLEYSALGLPGVYSEVGVYESCRDDHSGLLVENEPEAWAAAIARLAGDWAVRERLAGEAFRYVAENRLLGDDDGGYVEALRSVV